MSVVVGLVLGIGATAYGLLVAYRAHRTRVAYSSATATDAESVAPYHDGERRTVSGRVAVDEPAPCAAFLTGSDRSPLVVWRLRRGGSTSLRDPLRSDRDAKTTASGISAGRFRVDDGRRPIVVDPEWVTTRTGQPDVRSLSESDLTSSAPWSRHAWTSPYVDLNERRRVVWLDEVDSVPQEVRAATGDELGRYQLQARYVLPGDRLTTHGVVAVEQGVPELHGSAEVPLTVSDRSPDAARRRLRDRTVRTAAVSLALVAAGVGFLAWSVLQLVG